MNARHEMERRGQLVPIGRIMVIETEHGVLRFPGSSGPTVAYAIMQQREGDNAVPDPSKLLMITPWGGLPSIHEKGDEPCPECMSDCDICGATGEKVCEGWQCGGRGWVPGPSEVCTAPGCLGERGKFNPECTACAGQGEVFPHLPCPMCHGAKVMICPVCKGAQQRPTGLQNGSTNWQDGACPKCHGTKANGKEVPQDLEKHVNAWIGPMPVIGPIVGMTIQCIAGMRPPVKQIDVTADANGDYLVLLLEPGSRVTHGYFLGGSLHERGAAA
jgi:hypothetical protein